MLKVALALSLLTSALIATSAFGAEDLNNPGLKIPKKNIFLLASTGNNGVKLLNIYKDAQAPADLVLVFADSQGNPLKRDVLFHNDTEADWFFQFIQQIKTTVIFQYSDMDIKPTPKKHAIAGANFTWIDNYLITIVDGQDNVLIKDTASIANLHGATQANQTISIVHGTNVGLDGFADQIRDSLEDKGVYYGDEGEDDFKEKQEAK